MFLSLQCYSFFFFFTFFCIVVVTNLSFKGQKETPPSPNLTPSTHQQSRQTYPLMLMCTQWKGKRQRGEMRLGLCVGGKGVGVTLVTDICDHSSDSVRRDTNALVHYVFFNI